MAREMKDSGFVWLGQIPHDWEIRKLKHYYTLKTGFTPDTKKQEYYDETGYDWVNISDLSDGATIYETRKKISQAYVDAFSPEQIPAGSLMYSFKLSVGQTSFAGKPLFTNEAIASFLDSETVDLHYLRYSSSFIIENAQTNIYNAKILNQDLINNAYVPFPPLAEQARIAAFLDRKCAEIDSVIADTQRTIEEYKKLKQSVITQAVTKGIRGERPMKDSGIEWIGEIPVEWGIRKLFRAIDNLGDIDHYMPNSVDTGIPYLMTGDLKEKLSDVDFDSCKMVSLDDYQTLSSKIKANKGDIIFARYATIGTVCFVDIEKEFLVSYSCLTIKPTENLLLGRFMFYYLKSSAFFEEVNQYINSNTQANVGLDSMTKAKVILPKIEEQTQIADYLDKKCAEIDTLIAKKTALLEELESYKKSVIYEYVTGKKEVPACQ